MAAPIGHDKNLGERLSSLEAKVEGMDKYAHEKWHDLGNTLQPLVNLPVQLTRDVAKIQGGFDGRIATITKDIERSITSAVEKAIEPVNADIADLKVRIASAESRCASLETKDARAEGERGVLLTIFKSPVLAWLITVIGAAWALLTGKVQV